MPMYSYQCDCGIQFEASAPMKDHQKPQPCPGCKSSAPRRVPDDVAGVFHQSVTGPGPQNTGLAQLDAHIDRVIGQAAQQNWAVIDQRNADKEQLARDRPGLTHGDVVKTPNGGYDLAKPQIKGFYDRAHAINSAQERTRAPKR